MLGRTFYYRGYEWATPFLDTESRLSHSERQNIVLEVINIYLNKERTKKIKGENYEGRISKKGHTVWEGHTGPKYVVELDCDFQQGENRKLSRLEFILINLSAHLSN